MFDGMILEWMCSYVKFLFGLWIWTIPIEERLLATFCYDQLSSELEQDAR